MKRNVTLALDEELLHRARIVCQKKRTTLTRVIRDRLEDLVRQNEEYQSAMERIIARMKERPIKVGKKTWTRDELHAR
jgi:uncharacterized membrane protein